MKNKYLSILGVLVTVILIASFIVPGRLMSPQPVAGYSGIMEWVTVDTPDTQDGSINNIFSPIVLGGEAGSEIVKLLVSRDGYVMYAIISQVVANPANTSKLRLYKSYNGGISWGGVYAGLVKAVTGADLATVIVWDIAIAPDNPEIIVAAVSVVTSITNQMVFISVNGGTDWHNTNWPGAQAPAAGYAISTLDISVDYGGRRDILVGVRDGTATAGRNKLWIMKTPGYGGWNVQNTASGSPPSTNPFNGDIVVAKFSPTYNGDLTIAVVYSDSTGTYLVTGAHDVSNNSTNWQAPGSQVEIKNATAAAGSSPRVTEIITADLEMPSDFSGQSASLRRFYVCTDAINRSAGLPNRGVYRIDDNIVYTLMDNSTTFKYQADNQHGRRAASIAYWGTYASGKLLVGERLGNVCTASVPVWFTDSPTVCPIPCWYPPRNRLPALLATMMSGSIAGRTIPATAMPGWSGRRSSPLRAWPILPPAP